jgi:hypothetical protein
LERGKQWFELSVVRKPTLVGEEERLIAIARNITNANWQNRRLSGWPFTTH